MAILSKAGCNAGACHGNANGKASFKLSLRGESPNLDFLALTHDQSARRVNVMEPEQSLILLKATTTIAHEGGLRFKTNSWEYSALLDWISHGASYDCDTAKKLQRLQVSPREAILIQPTNEIQITAKAYFSDKSERDVTEIAVFESANPAIKITPGGLIHSDNPCETTILVRYLDQQIPVRLAFIPARPEFKWSHPAPQNFIDRHIFAKLLQHRMNPSDLCSDEAFVRRAYLDLLGIIPTSGEARAFTLDSSVTKRAALIDELLERPEFADFWSLKWMDLLRAEERILDRKGLELFHRWVRQSILDHKPIDQFAREIISARGSTYKNPAANFYRAARTPVERSEAAAQLFFGRRIQCAQCHNHPFDRWSQDDYYDWQRVFARVKYKVLENRRRDDNDGHEFKGEQIIYLAPSAEIKNPRTGGNAKPRFLGESSACAGDDELIALASWATRADNPFFARAQVNRIWFHLFGRGLVEPLDDFRASNPASHPELLEDLASDFANHGFDLREIIRVIMNSRTYQLSSQTNPTNAEDESNFSHSNLRRLTAEQLLDSQSRAVDVPLDLAGYPTGTRAVQIAGSIPERRRGEGNVQAEQFLTGFGKPPRLLPSECERSCEPTMSQAFQLMNGPLLNQMLENKENIITRLLSSTSSLDQKITTLYWRTLSRAPSSTEITTFSAHLSKHSDQRAALEDVLWTLLNSKEFLFR